MAKVLVSILLKIKREYLRDFNDLVSLIKSDDKLKAV